MFDLSKLIAVVQTTAKAMVPGAPAAIEAGKAVLDLVQSVAPTLAETDQRKLQAALPPLLSKMNHNVDQAVRDLGGSG
jgi:hypothetical protein